MEVYEVVISICGIICITILALYKDRKEREAQYKKFLKDIADLFYSAMNQKKEEE